MLTCPEKNCTAKFPDRYAMAGHIGSAHRKTLVPIEHGTAKGYIMHLRRKEPFPEDSGKESCGCREAHATYQRERREAIVQ